VTTTQRKPRTITYFVNGEPQKTDERKLTVREILTNAGFTPAEDYELVRDHGHHKFTDLDQEVPIHKRERFTALFKGPTPVS